MIYSRITGTGSYLPEKIVTNDDLAKIVETSDEWITDRTGIKQRHIAAEQETASSMGVAAVKQALDAAKTVTEEIDMIIVASCTPDRVFPSTACLIQQQLGMQRTCIAFDVQAACAGFVHALSIADQYIKSGVIKTAVVVGTEILSRMVDWQDRTTCVLFGDGAGAVVLQASKKAGIINTHLHAQGSYKDILYLANDRAAPSLQAESSFVQMQGNDVFKLAVKKLGELVKQTLAENNLQQSDIDWLIPHQANIRIISATAKKLGMSLEQVVLTVGKHGNTSSASIPLALDEAVRDGRIKSGHNLLLEAIGGGMTWGSALIQF